MCELLREIHYNKILAKTLVYIAHLEEESFVVSSRSIYSFHESKVTHHLPAVIEKNYCTGIEDVCFIHVH
jgi:hypothetical protein